MGLRLNQSSIPLWYSEAHGRNRVSHPYKQVLNKVRYSSDCTSKIFEFENTIPNKIFDPPTGPSVPKGVSPLFPENRFSHKSIVCEQFLLH